MTNVSFDGTNLNSGNYSVRKVSHDTATERDLYMYGLTREAGAEMITTYYQPKKFIVEGIIRGDTLSDLEDNIDTFKKVLSGKNKNLDIEYSTGTRRYSATARIVQIERDYYHLNYAPYSVEFNVPTGFGKDTEETTYMTTSIALTTLEDTSLSIGGTVVPKYEIEITFVSATDVSEVSVSINGDKITVSEAISAGQVLVIDTANKIVSIDAVETDYTGLFPRLILGSNTYKIITTSTSHSYNVNITYVKKYL